MSKFLTITMTSDTIALLMKLPEKLRDGILKGAKESAKKIEKSVKDQIGSAGSIKNRTGFLRKSIKIGKIKENSSDQVVIPIGSDAIYAGIHEFGGVITPRVGTYLKFRGDKGWKTVKSVVIPPRPYFRPGIEKAAPSIKDALIKNVHKEIFS
jgi:phage gpG-like protein